MTGFTNFFLFNVSGLGFGVLGGQEIPGLPVAPKASMSSENDTVEEARVFEIYHWIDRAGICMRSCLRNLVLFILSILSKPNIDA